jgi:hypothetical protein
LRMADVALARSVTRTLPKIARLLRRGCRVKRLRQLPLPPKRVSV